MNPIMPGFFLLLLLALLLEIVEMEVWEEKEGTGRGTLWDVSLTLMHPRSAGSARSKTESFSFGAVSIVSMSSQPLSRSL